MVPVLEPLLDLSTHDATDPAVSGGPASSLARLARAGLRVPPGFVVTTAAYRAHLAACNGLRQILATAAEDGPDATAVARARQTIADTPLPADLAGALRPRLEALLREGALILRPSPTWPRPAGRPEPELGASRPRLDRVEQALATLPSLFAALWQDRVAWLPAPWEDGVAMAVIVQLCLRPSLTGVASPLSPGEDDKPLALHLRGAGADRATTQFITLPAGEPMAGDARGPSRLPAAQARMLASAYLQAQNRLGFPQDLGWAVAGGELFVLGSRPISRLPERWLRTPMTERFPQPLAPLTWDLLADGYERAFDRATQDLGLPPIATRWLSCVDGWVRVNQNAIDLCLAPMEPRWKNLAELERRLPEWAERLGWVHELPTAWLADLDRYLLRLGRLSAPIAATGSVAEHWRRVGALRELGLDFFGQHGRVELAGLALRQQLKRLLREAAGPELASGLLRDLLLAPEGRLAQLQSELAALRRLGRAPEARAWLTAADGQAAWLAGPPAGAEELDRRLRLLLADHGHIAARYDLAEPTWGEEPWRLMRLLADTDAAASRLPSLPHEEASPGDQALRVRRGQAEARLMALVPPGLRVFAMELLRLNRQYRELPELERYQVRRLAPALRRELLALGEHLRRSGALAEAGDVFQMGVGPLEAWIRSVSGGASRYGSAVALPLEAPAGLAREAIGV